MPAPTPNTAAEGSNLDLAEIQKIVELMAANNLSLFQWENADTAITLKRGTDVEDLKSLLGSMPSYGHAAPAPAPSLAPAAPAAPAIAPATEDVGPAIHSPMVGTFYRAPGPNEKIFANIGDSVDENTTVCIIEAMKVMNEIKAEARGTIARVLVEDGKPVQYGQPLFQLK